MGESIPNLTAFRRRYEEEWQRVVAFWLRHSLDRERGGYFNCLDRDGQIYDRTKHVWLQGRQVWMFAKLYRDVAPNPDWLVAARLGAEFLQRYAIRRDRRVYFSLSADGRPVYLQRKIFSECFYIMAMAEYGRASDRPDLLQEARDELAIVWEWAQDLSQVGRPALSGQTPARTLAVPMILLNVIAELDDDDSYRREIDWCLARLQLHLRRDRAVVYETVAPDGSPLDSAEGRLLNPGHAIEAGWFLQQWAQRFGRADLSELAIHVVRTSFARGWDEEAGGIFYFLDAEGYSPTPLEWSMKLWWPHCEALYAHLLNYSLTGDSADWEAFATVDAYAFDRFRDPEYGEWYGYCDRWGKVTHRFKGGPYKGCFHVPRALWLCWRLLEQLEARSLDSSSGPGNR